MKLSWARGKEKKDGGLGLFHAEAATGSIENAGIAYQAPTVIAAGANDSGVALLSSLTNLFLSIFLLKVPSLIDGPRVSIRRTVLILAIANSLTWAPIVLVMMLFTRVSPFLLTALWIFNIVPSVLLGPLRDYWMANIVPAEKMGRYLSWRSVITGASYIATYYAMGIVLTATKSASHYGFTIILLLALVASISSAFFYTRIKPPTLPETTNKEKNPGFVDFLKQARHSHLGVFILFVAMFTFATNLAGPLFHSYMLKSLQFSWMTFVLIISCEFIARIFSLTFWGKMVDKSGSLKVLKQVTYLIPFVPVLWLFSSNVAYLCLIQVFSGVVWSAFDLAVQTFVYKATTPEQRLRYIVYYRSLTSFSVALGALAGALLVNNVIPIFGSNILTLFLISGILRMVVARVMLPKLSQEGIPGAVIHEELAQELAALELPVFQGGLYYHPEAWGRFTRRAYIIGNGIGKTINKLNPAKLGLLYQTNQWSKYQKQSAKPGAAAPEENQKALYHHPQNWAEYMRQQAAAQPVKVTPNRVPVRDGLYYHRETWQQQNPALIVAKKYGTASIERKGLFHSPDKWLGYVKQGMALNATTLQNANGTILRQPVYYHPEIWARYQQQSAGMIPSRPRVSARPAAYQPGAWRQLQNVSRQTSIKTDDLPTATAPLRRLYQPGTRPQNTYSRTPGKLAPAMATASITSKTA